MKALGAPHPPPFSSRKSSILASSSHNIRGTLDNHLAQVGHSFALSERLLEIC